MDVDRVAAQMASQVSIAIAQARERFSDAAESYLKSKKTDLGIVTLNDKFNLERLFTEAVNAFVVAEMAAIMSNLIYSKTNNEDIIKSITPAFLDVYEGRMERANDDLVKKTSDLQNLAKRVLSAGGPKSPVAQALVRDISDMPRMKHLRASFDAAVLNFMGE